MIESVLKLPCAEANRGRIVDANTATIADCGIHLVKGNGSEIAREIVRRVNAFDALLAACKEMLSDNHRFGELSRPVAIEARAAIAAAEKEAA